MQSISQWFINDFVPAFGRTLVHSLWQGVAAAVLAGLVIVSTRRSSSAKRYNALVAVYVLFIVSVGFCFFFELSSSATIMAAQATIASQPLAVVVVESGVATSEAVEQSFMNNILSLVNQNAILLVGLWALLFIAQLTRMALGLRYVQTIKKKGTSTVAAEWTAWMAEMSSRLGIRQTVVLLQSQRIKVPVALGILKPVILVPVGLLTQLTTQQVEAVLLHELAHIRRKDYLVNLMQSFADAVFFFNPAVRWISSRIREERETCCDDIVMQHTTNKKDYVEALVSFSQMPLSSSYAMAIGSNKNHLLNRVKTIITRENSKLTGKEQATLLVGLIAIMAIGFLAFKPIEQQIKIEQPIKNETKAEQKEVMTEQKASTETKQIVATSNAKKAIENSKPLITKPVADTVPAPTKKHEPIKWRNMNTNIIDDGQGKTMQVLATAEDGNVYRIRKVDDKIVLLSVNDKEIAEKDYPKYYPVIDAIERGIKKSKTDAVKVQEHQKKMVLQKHEALNQQEALLLHMLEALQKQQANHDFKKLQYHSDTLVRLNKMKEKQLAEKLYKLQSNNYNEQEKMIYKQSLESYNENKKLFNQDKVKKHKINLQTNGTLWAIVADLLSNKLAESETTLSFTLTATELIVNGKTVDQDIFEIFKKKYIKNSRDSYSYERNGNSTKATIYIQ